MTKAGRPSRAAGLFIVWALTGSRAAPRHRAAAWADGCQSVASDHSSRRRAALLRSTRLVVVKTSVSNVISQNIFRIMCINL